MKYNHNSELNGRRGEFCGQGCKKSPQSCKNFKFRKHHDKTVANEFPRDRMLASHTRLPAM